MKAQRSSNSDRISALPEPIIAKILCHVPIQDAVRTSILSKNWRYNWTNIPRLAFNESHHSEVSTHGDNYELSTLKQTFSLLNQKGYMTKRCKFFNAIYQVLLLHQSPIEVFSLSMFANKNFAELDQIILHLSRINTLKKLKLCLGYLTGYMLPYSFFSMNQLTHLSLEGCQLLDDQRTFKGFGSLTILYLDNVYISKNTLLHFVSNCPLIKRIILLLMEGNIDDHDDVNITKLLDCLHLVEHFCITEWAIQCFVDKYGVPKEVPTALVNLKSFCFVDIRFYELFDALPFVALVIKSSPNLEKLRLKINRDDPDLDKDEIESINLQDYSDIWMEHLEVIELEHFIYLKQEMDFVKLILTKSPVLKKLSIFLYYKVTKDEEMMILRILLRSPRASPHVKIFVERRPDNITKAEFKRIYTRA